MRLHRLIVCDRWRMFCWADTFSDRAAAMLALDRFRSHRFGAERTILCGVVIGSFNAS